MVIASLLLATYSTGVTTTTTRKKNAEETYHSWEAAALENISGHYGADKPHAKMLSNR
jgi:hypothetical protein